MREIKFRAWSGSRMVQVDQITMSECAWSCENGIGVSIPYQPHIQLMQYTGLKDKNGIEIYEGDIVRGRFITEDVEPHIFEYLTDSEREAGSKLFTVDDIHFGYSSPVPDDLEVIGNIYENNKLLEAVNNG